MNGIKEIQHPVILFDGVCNLCNSSVQFVLKHDKKEQFWFASLQSAFGNRIIKHFGLPLDTFNSFILLEDEKIYTRSNAALKVAKKLDGIWSATYVFVIVPKFLRDMVYDFIARNRYKWFGKKETCMIPTPGVRNRFLN